MSLSISIGVSFIRFSFVQETYQGTVIEAKDNYYIFSSKLERFYVYEKGHPYEIGDILSIQGEEKELSFQTLESDFNFKEYLNKKGVFSELNDKFTNIVFQNPIRLRNYKNSVLSNYSSDTQSLIKNIFGMSSGESEIKSDMTFLHLSRLLSLSGIYLMAFVKLTTYLLSFLFKEKWAKLISIALTSVYAIFAFPKFSVIKVMAFLILRWINDYLLHKRFSYLSIVSISAFIFLFIDYYYAYQDSFILGFSIPVFSYFVNSSIRVKSKFKKRLLMVCSISLFMIPFELKFYNSINLLAYPLTLIFTPFFLIYVFLSILVMFSFPLQTLMNNYTSFLAMAIHTLKPLNISINIPSLPSYLWIIYYLLLILLLYYSSIKFTPIIKYLSLISISLGCLYCFPISNLFTSEVSFINVGQGDSTLIRVKNTTVMIDTGGSIYKDIANDVLIPYLRSKRIYDIDLLITTHDDYDHSGAVSTLMDNFKVKKYVTSYLDFPITANGITFTNYNNFSSSWSEENDKSLVVGFNLYSTHYLIMGDAPKEIENKIVETYPNLKTDIIKIGHHGSDTSTSGSFIKAIKPKTAIISVGRNNYGHPSSSVLKILKNNNVEIKRTDQNGTISYA